MAIKLITPAEVYRLQQESGAINIIDVREADEFAEVSSPLAINYPLSSFNPAEIAEGRDRRTPLFMLCRSGRRSLRAAELLINIGFESVYNISGGMMEWEATGLPVVRD